MQIDLLANQQLVVLLPGGDELHLIDAAGSTTVQHHHNQGPVYSFSIPSPAELDASGDQSDQQGEEDFTPDPAATEEGQARLFF